MLSFLQVVRLRCSDLNRLSEWLCDGLVCCLASELLLPLAGHEGDVRHHGVTLQPNNRIINRVSCYLFSICQSQVPYHISGGIADRICDMVVVDIITTTTIISQILSQIPTDRDDGRDEGWDFGRELGNRSWDQREFQLRLYNFNDL